MTREEVRKVVMDSRKRNFILELATSMGKTKIALEKVASWKPENILIVIPRLVLIDNWKDEIKKWNFDYLLKGMTFTTYVSLPKYAGKWDVVIFDEGHHTSDRCKAALRSFTIKHSLVLSATLKKDHRLFFKTFLRDVDEIKVGLTEAIESNVLPDPRIILLPLHLNSTDIKCLYSLKQNKKTSDVITVPYKDKWKYRNYNSNVFLKCTQLEYYQELSKLIEWYKNKASSSIRMKKVWLQKAGERLKWLALQKEDFIKNVLKKVGKKRTLIFCATIKQSENLGCPCVNSKIGTDNLELFNKGKIGKIACINQIDEGINLVNCQVGIFQVINASQRMQLQKMGRILRHKKPVLIIPYFVATREEEIVKSMLEGYNKEFISTFYTLNELKV